MVQRTKGPHGRFLLDAERHHDYANGEPPTIRRLACQVPTARFGGGPVRVAAGIEGASSSGGRPAACAAICRAILALVREAAPLLAGAS